MKIIQAAILLASLGACVDDAPDPARHQLPAAQLTSAACAESGRCAQIGERTWYVDDGLVFSTDGSSAGTRWEGARDVERIIEFKGRPVILNVGREVAVAIPHRDWGFAWVKIAEDSYLLESTCDHLFVSSNNRLAVAYGGTGPGVWRASRLNFKSLYRPFGDLGSSFSNQIVYVDGEPFVPLTTRQTVRQFPSGDGVRYEVGVTPNGARRCYLTHEPDLR